MGFQPQISNVFRDHQNNFFSQQVRTILVTKYHYSTMLKQFEFCVTRFLPDLKILVMTFRKYFEKTCLQFIQVSLSIERFCMISISHESILQTSHCLDIIKELQFAKTSNPPHEEIDKFLSTLSSSTKETLTGPTQHFHDIVYLKFSFN